MLNNILMFGLIIVIGFALTKLKVFKFEDKNLIGTMIVRLTSPLLIFTSLTSMQKNSDLIRDMLLVMLWSAIGIGTLMAIGLFSAKLLRMSPERSGVQAVLTTFGNVVFIAFPLLEALFGAIGIFYAAFYHLINDLMLWTVGRVILDKKTKITARAVFQKLTNPNIIALFLGIICFLMGWRLPEILHNPLNGLGRITVYLALLFIGISISRASLKILIYPPVYLIVAVKMLIVPIALAFTMSIAPFGLSDIPFFVVALQCAMPCMTVAAILAHDVGADYMYASETIFLTTVLSLGTLPLVYYIIQLF